MRSVLLGRSVYSAPLSVYPANGGSWVGLEFALPETAAVALRARLDEAGQGRLLWLDRAGDRGVSAT